MSLRRWPHFSRPWQNSKPPAWYSPGPAGTAPRLVERLNRDISEIAASPELRALLEPDGMLPLAMTSPAFSARIKQELEQWKQVAAARKIVVE